jgi:transposase
MTKQALIAEYRAARPSYEELLSVISAKDQTIAQLNEKIADLNHKLLQKEEDYIQLKVQLDYLTKQLYGQKSEKFISADKTVQGDLFNPHQEEAPKTEPEPVMTQKIAYQRKTNHQGRKLLEGCGHLSVKEYIIEVEHDENDLMIGKEISNKIAIEVEKLYIKRTIRPKYKNTKTGEIKIAPLPAEALPKCEADASLLSAVVVSKFVDHTPEYRQQQIFKRQGVSIAPSTMNNWTHEIAVLVNAVAQQIKKTIITGGYLQMDESPIKVLFTKKDKSHQGYMWVMHDPVNKNTYFEYQKGRNRAGPWQMLKDFKGKLQTDGYAVYQAIESTLTGIEHYNCWAHARRKFNEALDNDAILANQAMEMIQKLYRTESQCREQNCTTEQRKAIRTAESIPVLEQIKKWLDEKSRASTPASPIGKAISYSLKCWRALVKYAQTGEVEIDNNLVENAIRPLALGRKNYLFAGGHDAAQNIATFYTLLGTCKAQGINPYNYMLWLLQNIATTPISRIQTLTPNAYNQQTTP